jgi:hypothetical protein
MIQFSEEEHFLRAKMLNSIFFELFESTILSRRASLFIDSKLQSADRDNNTSSSRNNITSSLSKYSKYEHKIIEALNFGMILDDNMASNNSSVPQLKFNGNLLALFFGK